MAHRQSLMTSIKNDAAMRLLKDITDIQIGYQHRDKFRPIDRGSTGSHRIIQIKDLDLEDRFKGTVLERGGIAPYVWPGNLYQITPSGDADRYLVNKGDVLFLSRGQRSFAVSIAEPLENAIAAYYFYILRPDAERVLPEYLAWFINQPKAQSFLKRHQRGSHMQMISKTAFEELEVALPPLAIQRSIVKLEQLRQKEKHTMNRLANARKRLVNGIALQAALKGNSTELGEQNDK